MFECPGWKFVGNFYGVLNAIVGWCCELMNVPMKIRGPCQGPDKISKKGGGVMEFWGVYALLLDITCILNFLKNKFARTACIHKFFGPGYVQNVSDTLDVSKWFTLEPQFQDDKSWQKINGFAIISRQFCIWNGPIAFLFEYYHMWTLLGEFLKPLQHMLTKNE